MHRTMKALGVLLTALALVHTFGPMAGSSAYAAVYDLTADWSDVSNPNGVWSYNSGGVPLTSTIRVSDPWAVPQVSWGDLPGWFQSNGTELFPHDWQAGDVITHTGPSEVTWTSPEVGLADITGAVWPTRDIGRFNQWEVLLNGSVLTSGVIGDGDPFSRATPFDFANGSGGASVLSDIPIGIGDVIELRLTAFNGSTADYAGAELTITTSGTTAVPGPSGLELLALGVFGLSWFGRSGVAFRLSRRGRS